MLKSIFFPFSAVGFSGARRWVGSSSVLSSAAAAVPWDATVFVGCAPGVDKFFRSFFPSAQVFSVASGQWGRGRGATAARSMACVSAVRAAGGLWVSFPVWACPAGLLPSASSSRCFSGSGSGSWASLAFALGSGVPCLVFLGSVTLPPGWGLFAVPGCPGWFASPSLIGLPHAVQLSLF